MNTLPQLDFFKEPKAQRLDLQARDIKMLEALYDMRYATVAQLATLYPSAQAIKINPNSQFRGGQEAIRKRLIKLNQHGYVDRVSFQIRRPNEPTVYILGQEGARALALHSDDYPYDELMKHVRYIRKYTRDKRTQNKYIFINHELGINTFRVSLYAALRNHSQASLETDENDCPKWLQPNLQNKFKIKVKVARADLPKILERTLKETTITKVPDALFTLNSNGHKIACLYEKDKGTEKHSIIATKLLCYLQWFKQGEHKKLFGTKHLRVLIETESEQRVKNMINKAALPVRTVKGKATGAGIFWFTSQDKISLDNPAQILEPIWTVGHINHLDEKHSLLEI